MIAVNIRFGRLADMPKCTHGRVVGFCDCHIDPAPTVADKIDGPVIQPLNSIGNNPTASAMSLNTHGALL